MATTTENRPRPITGAESEFNHASRAMPRPEIRVSQSNQGAGNAIAYIIAALVIAVGGYYFYISYYNPAVVAPAITQTTPPPTATAPAVDMPVVTPPAATSTTPPTIVPATPSATKTTC